MRLALFPKQEEGVTGLGLVVLEPDATVQDLADAFQPYAGCEGSVYKRKLKGSGGCRACVDSCCTTSVIAPDPISFDRTANFLKLEPHELLDQRCDPAARVAGVVRLQSFPCTFLGDDGTCTIYDQRSLICRFFICCPYSPDLSDLVHNILGAGLAALADRLKADGLLTSQPSLSDLTNSPNLGRTQYEQEFCRFYQLWVARGSQVGAEMPPAWHDNPFRNVEAYDALPLYQFATASQWRRLTRGALSHPQEVVA